MSASMMGMRKLSRDLLDIDYAALENVLRKFSREDLGVLSKMVAEYQPKAKITDLLFVAIEKNYYKTVELTLLFGPDYEEERRVNYSLVTPLILASKLNQSRIVSLLLRYGADPNHSVPNRFVPGNTYSPLIEAITYHDNPLLVQILLDAGVNIEGKMDKESPLMTAVINRHYETVNYLLDRGAYTLEQMNSRILLNAVLHEVMSGGVPNLEIIRRLIEHGANLDAVDIFNEKAIDKVKQYNPDNKELLYLLTSYKGDYFGKNRKMLSEHMIPDLSNITMKYLD